MRNGADFKNASDFNVESVRAAKLTSQQLPAATGSSFLLLFTDSQRTYASPAFEQEVRSALATLASDRRVTSIHPPYSAPPEQAPAMISTDRHSVIAAVNLSLDFASARQQFAELRSEVHATLQVSTDGDVAVASDFDTILAGDLRRSEVISLPLALIFLVIVFGTGIAALLCLGVGVLAVVSGIGITALLAHGFDVSTYAINVVTLIGLGIAIDYSPFIVTRLREELAQDGDAGRALGVTMATAGRAIAFSGMTVALGLAGLLFFSGTSLVSMGAAGAIVVVISVVFGLTFLPALLAILGVRVNRLSVPIFQPRPFGKGAWHRIATWVMRRPWFVLLRYVSVDPAIGIAGYQALYQQPRASWPASVQQAASTSTGSSIAVFDAATPYLTTSDQAHSLVRAIRAHGAVTGATVQVTGNTAFDLDFVGYMVGHIPLVVAFVAVATLAVLLLLLRSVVLPLKAVLMNALSLSAAFGALVWVFQDGHLSGLLGFTPGPLDPTIPVLRFCIVFGLSMDYEVFLLTRMQEEWRRTEDNRTAVAGGLERSGRPVTGAALIMACVFIAFGLASVVTIKALGLGMAIAVVVDATLVRALVVPAPMRLLGRANWWSPRWRQRRRVLEDQRAAAA